MKRTFAITLLLALSCASASCGNETLEVMDSSATKDGVTLTLTSAATKRYSSGFTYTFEGTLQNNAAEGITQVAYTVVLIGKDGKELTSYDLVYDAEDVAIRPNAQVNFTSDAIIWRNTSVPASVKLSAISVKTEAELPPAHVPKEGEYLYQALRDKNLENIKEEPPVKLSLYVDQGGSGRTAIFREGAVLDKAVELFCAIQIGKESEEWVTDNYNGITLTWENGSESHISLNLYNLELSVHSKLRIYDLQHLDEFWSFCSDYLGKC